MDRPELPVRHPYTRLDDGGDCSSGGSGSNAHSFRPGHLYAVGGNERAARLAGIRVQRVVVLTYVFSALCAGLVGMVIASQLEAAHPATGESFELNAIAAVVLGGTSLMGGRGSIGGSLIGAFVIKLEFWQTGW